MWDRISNYFKEVVAEIKKVTWPTKKETAQYTILVIAISVGLSLFLGALDAIFNFGLDKLIN